jgi:hypothetical protein
MIKTPTIMKQNPLIMAEFEKAFSEVDHDIVNILLHSLQNNLLYDGANINLINYKQVLNRKIVISAPTFKELGKFGVNANDQIFEALKKIRDTSAIIRNFTDIDGKFIKAKTVSLIDDVRLIAKSDKDARENEFEIQFNEWFLQTSTRHFNQQVGNYTNVKIVTVASLKSKHAKKLYEILESQKYKHKSFAIKLKTLNRVFNLEDKPLSYFTKIINIAKPLVDQLIKFEYEVHKKDKLISFNICE